MGLNIKNNMNITIKGYVMGDYHIGGSDRVIYNEYKFMLSLLY